MLERRLALVVSTAALVLVLWPLTWQPPRDSFPLSSYPMFAHGRRSARLVAIYAVALAPGGARHWIPPSVVANREVLQARATLERAARGGPRALRDLCRSIAARIGKFDQGELADASEVTILRGSHDALVYFESGALGPERQLTRCPVPGR